MGDVVEGVLGTQATKREKKPDSSLSKPFVEKMVGRDIFPKK